MMIRIIIHLIIGFLLADFAAGVFHWFEDSYLDYCLSFPILGDIAKDNEMHHYFPRSILAYSYLENTYTTFALVIILLIFLFCFNKPVLYKYKYLIGSFSFFAINSNFLHKLSHMRDCENNVIVKSLQKCGLLCSHEHHKTHHTLINEKYCVITEYNNFVLDNIHFWRGVEYIIYCITGIQPVRKKSSNNYDSQTHLHENAKLQCPDTPTRADVEYLKKKLEEEMNCK